MTQKSEKKLGATRKTSEAQVQEGGVRMVRTNIGGWLGQGVRKRGRDVGGLWGMEGWRFVPKRKDKEDGFGTGPKIKGECE